MATTCLKALAHLLDKHACQKELSTLMNESIRELDVLFLQLSSQPNTEKGLRLLPQLGNRLHSLLEQFQLLGNFADAVHKFFIDFLFRIGKCAVICSFGGKSYN